MVAYLKKIDFYFCLAEYLKEGCPLLERIFYVIDYGIYTSDLSYLSSNGVPLHTLLSVLKNFHQRVCISIMTGKFAVLFK